MLDAAGSLGVLCVSITGLYGMLLHVRIAQFEANIQDKVTGSLNEYGLDETFGSSSIGL